MLVEVVGDKQLSKGPRIDKSEFVAVSEAKSNVGVRLYRIARRDDANLAGHSEVDDRDRSGVEIDEEVLPAPSRVDDRCATKVASKLFDALPANRSATGYLHTFDPAANSQINKTAPYSLYFGKLRQARRD